MTRLIACYGVAQIALLPLYALYLWVVPTRAGLRFQWILHRALFCLTIILPFALLAPIAVTVPRPAQAAVHSIAQAIMPGTFAADTASFAAVKAHALALPASVFLLLPCLGLLFFCVRLGRQKLREQSIARKGLRRRIGRVEVIVSQLVVVPFSTGVLRPRIYLSPAVSEAESAFSMVFRHEATHIRRRHWLWTVAESFVAHVFWFNPLVHLLPRGGRQIRELLCDTEVCRRSSPTAYGHLLLDTITAAGGRVQPALIDSWATQRRLRDRLGVLMEKGRIRMKGITRILSTGAMVLAAVLFGLALPVLAPAAARSPSSDGSLLDWAVPFQAPVTITFPSSPGTIITFKVDGSVTISSFNDWTTPAPWFSGGIDYFVPPSVKDATALADAVVTGVSTGTDGAITVTLRTVTGYELVYGNLRTAPVKPREKVSHGESVGGLASVERDGHAYSWLHLAIWKDGKELNPFAPLR